MRPHLWLVVLAATTAGCGGLVTGGGTPTVTPVDVPAQSTPTETPARIAPGVARFGVVDTSALGTAHADLLERRSFTLRQRLRVKPQADPDSQWITYEERIAVETRTHYSVSNSEVYYREGDYPVVRNNTEYAAGGWIYSRYGGDPEATTYDVRRMRGPPGFTAEINETIQRYLTVAESNVTIGRFDGQRYYLIRGKTAKSTRVNPIYNLTVTAYVTEEGFVRALNASFIGGNTDSVLYYEYSFTYRKVGETTVDRPAWIDAAREQSNLSAGTPAGGTPTAETAR
ncbi:MAG: hypothetical protein ABEH35_07715 [Haloarculaceae archaeon]